MIRISERVWEGAKDPELLVQQLNSYLQKHSMWIWRQPARYMAEDGSWRGGAVRPVMLSMEKDALLKLILRPAAGTGADYQLVALRKARQVEVYEAMAGRSLKGEQFQILRPWENVTDVVIIIHPNYLKLSPHLKQPIINAWNRLTTGLQQRKTRMGEDTLFILTGTPDRKWLAELDMALADAEAGRVTVDPYETRRAAELCEKYGEKCGE